MPENTAAGPFTPSAAYTEAMKGVQICRDTYGGTLAMREAGETYLGKYELEKSEGREGDQRWEKRLSRAVLYNGMRSTVRALAGMVFRKDVMLKQGAGEDDDPEGVVPEPIQDHWQNIDLTGRHGSVFARSCFRAKLKDGLTIILVDWSGEEGAVRAADEAEARPYWVHIKRHQVLRWRTRTRMGATELVTFAYVENFTAPDGDFGEKAMQRAYQYDLEEDGASRKVRWRTWTRKAESGDQKGTLENDGYLGDRMDRIPVVIDYAEQEGVMEADPPLLDLANENVLHWQTRSDMMENIRTSNVPVFWTSGLNPEEFKVMAVGAHIGLSLPVDGSCGFAETTAAAITSTREEIHAIERRMASMGLSNLVEKPRGSETAEARRMEKSERDSDLAAMARATEDALENALQIHAQWMDLDSGGTCEVNRDFGIEVLSPQMVAALSALVGENLSLETFWDIMLQGNILPENFDAELERERITTGGFAPLPGLEDAA